MSKEQSMNERIREILTNESCEFCNLHFAEKKINQIKQILLDEIIHLESFYTDMVTPNLAREARTLEDIRNLLSNK